MQHTTRRLKRLERSTSSNRVLTDSRLHKSNGDPSQLQLLADEDPASPASSSRHRRAVQLQLDPLRGAMLVAIIVVTIVLYLALWQLERSSFSSVVPSGSHAANGTAAISQPFVTSKRISEKYPVTVVQDASISRPTDSDQPNSRDSHSAVSSTDSSTMDRLRPGKAATWPPPITRVPDEHTGGAFKDSEETASFHTNKDDDPPSSLSDSFDVACNGTCRFLLPVRVGEQESKARLHFIQLLKLAERLNRTLVLPNVGKSRMSVCSKWPFEAYYDMNAFTSHLPGLPTTTNLSTFMRWIEERPAIPSSYFVSMDSASKDIWRALGSLDTGVDLPFIVEDSGVDSKVTSCLETKLPRLRSSVPATGLSIVFGSGSLEMHRNASDQVVQLLSGRLHAAANPDFDLMTGPGYEYPHPFPEYSDSRDSTSLADMNVLVVDYDLRHPLFASSDSGLYFNLHYAPALYDLADRISENVGPFVGVHWRMENVPVENLAWCAASLISKLYRILQDEVMGKNVRHVWLATDYTLPLVFNTQDAQRIPGGSRNQNMKDNTVGDSAMPNHGPPKKSSTFKTISPEHEDAMEMLTEAFQSGGDLDSWKLTDLEDQLRWYPYVEGKFTIDETLLDDSGVFGILDKLVVVNANVFVSGSPECSKVSSFSKQVVEVRKEESVEARRGRDSLRNVVEYFGK